MVKELKNDEGIREFIKKIQVNQGEWLELPDFDMLISWDKRSPVSIRVCNKVDSDLNHKPLNEDQIMTLIKDLQDLSDWRHYRRLMNKLKN